MHKAVQHSPSTISGKELPGLAISGCPALLCTGLGSVVKPSRNFFTW